MESSQLVVSQDFDAPIEKVWKALTDPEEMKEWYFDIDDFDFQEDAEFHFYESDKKEFKHACKIQKIVPFKQFVHTWTNPDQTQGVSVVTWNLESLSKNKTRLTLVHDGLEDMADGGDAFSYDNYQKGWNDFINVELVKYLEDA